MERKKQFGNLLTRTVEKKIINIIKENKMQPGDKLKNEYELAELLEVGRGTIREAIKSLVSRNILEVRQGAGTFVSNKNGIPEDPLGLTFIGDIKDNKNVAMDLLDIRLMLEPEIAAMAAVKGTVKQIKSMLVQCKIVEELIKKGEDYREADILFHKRIAQCSGNRVMENLIPIINSSVSLTINLTEDIFRENTYIEHRAVAEAIASGDSLGAKCAMIVHLNTNRRGMEKNFSQK
ncbi:FadR/GntR family transcriptional regulator [Fusobacterium ulcerans]|uniref:FadR/GntR family transcriptional regulator n=1 Tax=Fusobacterium ulcerans TaxID=861 RepID=UPI0026739170|nr:FadR/GntR family transcriptional regulator [Fusobacterium ulcerans]